MPGCGCLLSSVLNGGWPSEPYAGLPYTDSSPSLLRGRETDVVCLASFVLLNFGYSRTREVLPNESKRDLYFLHGLELAADRLRMRK